MHSARELAMRDPALAALTGAISGADFGSDFGGEFYGDDGFGEEAGEFYGDFGFMGAEAAAAPPPSQQAMMAVWRRHNQQVAHTQRRAAILNPNEHSSLKLEGFVFPINPTVNPVFGTASAVTMNNQPSATIRPHRVVFNVTSPALFMVGNISVNNIGTLLGRGAFLDAYQLETRGVNLPMNTPTMSTADNLTITGNWTTLVPPGFVATAAFPLAAAAYGPSKMAG